MMYWNLKLLEEKMRENLLFSKWIFCCVFLVIFLKNFFLKDFRSIWLLVDDETEMTARCKEDFAVKIEGKNVKLQKMEGK